MKNKNRLSENNGEEMCRGAGGQTTLGEESEPGRGYVSSDEMVVAVWSESRRGVLEDPGSTSSPTHCYQLTISNHH